MQLNQARILESFSMSHKGLSPRSDEATARREFLTQIGKAAATAPAIALLLAASSKTVSAQYGPQDGGGYSEAPRHGGGFGSE
jgi:uncharacterized membrane protein